MDNADSYGASMLMLRCAYIRLQLGHAVMSHGLMETYGRGIESQARPVCCSVGHLEVNTGGLSETVAP
mgnify:FL=1